MPDPPPEDCNAAVLECNSHHEDMQNMIAYAIVIYCALILLVLAGYSIIGLIKKKPNQSTTSDSPLYRAPLN